jgi:hypothetical protein
MLPHERSLVTKYAGKPFALVGVNSDGPEELKEALKNNPVTWRSFKNKRAEGKEIAGEWQVSGWPTLYLVDHQGIIRKRWVGSRPVEVLDREIDLLVEAAVRAK